MERHCAIKKPAFAVVAALLLLLLPSLSSAHGLAGKRFFPTTLAVDDPFVSDELSLLVGHIKSAGEGGGSDTTTSVSIDYSKRITKDLGLSLGESYSRVKPSGGDSSSGFGNLEVGLKYQFFKNDEHETILSAGVGAEIGGTGSRSIGSESFTVLTPAVFFGKGLGDLPDAAKFLRPLAITGIIGPNIPTKTSTVVTTVNPDTGGIEEDIQRNPTTLSWGFTLQYSLQYLQTYVKDVGLSSPLNRSVLVVEFPFETCLTGDCKGKTTGFVNPGLLWFGKQVQLGIEAQIPVNSRTGKNVGILGLVHFFLDDLFPQGLGRPVFR
ncbi:MAG: hypothetical protein M0024_05840 [Nitrospiraceae bacterium]|nr:hypothetical protein [Nitrospiraceae bacterium]